MRFPVLRTAFVAAFVVLLATTSVPSGGIAAPALPTITVPGGADQSKGIATVYVVQMADDPVVAYRGGVPGLRATAPAGGRKLDPQSGAVRRYVAYLTTSHDRVLSAVAPGTTRLYDFHYSFNGFAALLTTQQASALRQRPEVVAVTLDAERYPTTDRSPSFLGLDADGGLWELAGGRGAAGEGIIVGVIDTGIWPEHPSFSDQTDLANRPGASGKRSTAYGPPPAGWSGVCQAGEQFSEDDCNNKLIGARYFLNGFGHQGALVGEFLSARDADGHGTHTSSTAAGNAGVKATVLGNDFGEVSGMAPRARVAAYKACWHGRSGTGCFLSDLVAAIDLAVADGVDVINYSIGGGPSLVGPDEIAFLFAARAGVFAATSAGNSGPGPGSIGGPATVPWVTSVGASTHDRTFLGTVTLGDATELTGVTLTGGTSELGLVDSKDAGSELCVPGELTPALVGGKLVLCKRGAIARVDKSRAVFIAGGAGMVLYNDAPNMTLNADIHWVPALHVDHASGLAIKDYIGSAGAGATGQLSGGAKTTVPAPDMASFSSRGPNPVAPDIIKPDITAPGVNILAGHTAAPVDTSAGVPGQAFQVIGGTSMSSPHVAGVGALLKQLHPDWTPAMIKSALMTTAYQGVKKEDGATPADPFDFGAGHLSPNPAADPGLVYDTGFPDYLRFLCGAGAIGGAVCSDVGSIDPSDLNVPSIGIAELAGTQTVTRTVTNVGPSGDYVVSVDPPPGIAVVVSPATLSLGPGASASYEVAFTTLAGAVLDQWSFGSISWSHGPHTVRSPLAIRPVAIAAPEEVSGAGTEGSLSYDVTFGYSGDFSAVPHGLVAADLQPDNVIDDPANDIDAALATSDFSSFPFECTGITWHLVTLPADTRYLRLALFDEYTDGSDDLDLYVWEYLEDWPFPLVGASFTGTSAEEVNVPSPGAGPYAVAVHGWQTDGPDANYTLFAWSVTTAAAGNLAVTAPATAVTGSTAGVTLEWSGLDTGKKYLGTVTYHDSASPAGYEDGLLEFTVVRVDTD